MAVAAYFSIFVGILMAGQWAFFLVSRQVPELKTEPARIAFHLAAEFLTAAALIAGGTALLAGSLLGYPLALLALGMLLYSLIASPGYFAQNRQWLLVAMFAVLLVLAIVSTFLLISSLGEIVRVGFILNPVCQALAAQQLPPGL